MRPSTLKTLSTFILLGVLLSMAGIAGANPSPAPEKLAAPDAPPPVPNIVSYQGQVRLNGALYNGTGYFKFAIVGALGTTTFWSNDGTSAGGSEPAAAISLPVNAGQFTVLLGANMTALTSTVFAGEPRLLRVWFSDTGSSFQQLNPDQRIAAVPYALQAEHAWDADTLDSQHATAFQFRVTGACAVGSSIRAINANGSVVCDSPRTGFYPLLQAQALDLAPVDAALGPFSGSFTDGRYGYFVPAFVTTGYQGSKVARVDLGTFNGGGVTVLDLALADPGLKGFNGGFTDGRYGYFVPYRNSGSTYSGKIARVDLQDFTLGGVTVLDLALVDSQLKGFAGGFTDGRYGYFTPSYNGSTNPGKLARVDLQNFNLIGGVTVLDLTLADPDLRIFSGGFTDGLYAYLAPRSNNSDYSGKVTRVDLRNFTPGGITVLDLAALDPGLAGFSGGFSDGRYGYFTILNNASGYSGKVARVDLLNFSPTGVSSLDLAAVDPTLKGFQGGFTDGRFAYFAPKFDGSSYFGQLARVDLQDFSPAGVTFQDLTALDGSLKGFTGGFTDGRFGYLAPFSGQKIARIQLLTGVGSP